MADAFGRRKTIDDLLDENSKLRALVAGQVICDAEDADGRECPLYDANDPYRCKRDRYMRELGLDQ